MSEADDRFAIIATLDRYAECLDTRDWAGLSDVFTNDVHIDFGAWQADSLDAVRENISSFLDGCGPSQHLLGNYRINLDGDTARSCCYCYVMHQGKGTHEGKSYETWIEYCDELRRGPGGWRSYRRHAKPRMHRGDMSLLGPGDTDKGE